MGSDEVLDRMMTYSQQQKNIKQYTVLLWISSNIYWLAVPSNPAHQNPCLSYKKYTHNKHINNLKQKSYHTVLKHTPIDIH